MKIDTFEYIWRHGIAKAAQDVFDEISPALREKYSVRIDVSNAMCQKLYHQYFVPAYMACSWLRERKLKKKP